MREKRKLAEYIRMVMLAVLCIALALLGLRQCRKWLTEYRVKWENQGFGLLEKSSSLAGRAVEFLWNQRLPEKQAEQDLSLSQGKLEFVVSCMERLNPWNTYQEPEAPRQISASEVDPAYGDFLESRDFYIEHQYFLEYGNEESGQVDQNPAEVQKQADEQEDTGITDSIPSGITSDSGKVYSMAQLADYDFLMKTFYNTHTSTTAGRDMICAETMLETDLTLERNGSIPQILIYHSHSQEAYADSGENQTVVEVGDYLTELLEAKGFGVIHDRSVYDLVNEQLDRSKAYTYALEGITKILEENPDIQVVLDLHRDGVGDNVHLVSEVNGKPTAQIMFFNGLSRTPEGPVEYLPNPYLNENLAFSFQMQLKAAEAYPGFTRKIYLKGLRYNLHLRPRSSLIEVGAQTNTFEEARNAMEPLAEILEAVLTEK